MARRNMRAAIKRAAAPKKAAAKKKKAPSKKRPKAALSKGYWEVLERIERGVTEAVRLLKEIHVEVTPPKGDPPDAPTGTDEAGD